MNLQDEKKKKRISLMISLGIHVALMILFFFVMAWRQPNPPYPEYGIELNFGLEEAGAGAEQPETRPAPQTREEPQEPVEEIPPATSEAEETPEASDEQAEEAPVVQPEPSPIIEKQKTEEPAPEEPVKKPEPAEKKKQTVEAKKTEEKPKEPASPVEENKTEKGAGASQGDDKNATGDAGKPEGTVDARSLFGSRGGGGGASLNLAGWNWDYIPKPEESSNETGTIVFRIQVDERGEITNIVTLEKTVSPAVERVYRQAVERLTFSRTSGGPIAPLSTGTITFTIRAK